MDQGFMLRDVLNNTVVAKLAESISKNWKPFNKKAFITDIALEIEALSFGDRSKLICNNLKKYLPEDYESAIKILLASLSKPLENGEMPKFEDFIVMPQCLFVSTYGLEHYELSINALYEMTKRFTAEGDIRPFILKYPEKTMDVISKWAEDPNFHVRRLASEGTRPRLPLGIRLPLFQKDPKPVIAILEKLKNDPELYVRRSVANNLNDIAKDNPDIVTQTLKAWSKNANEDTNWMIKHALRTLLKQGNKEALALLGYSDKTALLVDKLRLSTKKVSIGESIQFDFEIISNSETEQNLMIDYAIYHLKANGKNKPKVFKLAKKVLKAGTTEKISKKHSFKPISTRAYYTGTHYLELKINGKNYFMEEFTLA